MLNRERRVSDEPEYAGPSTSRAALLPPPPSSYDFPPAEATQQQQAIVYAPSPPPQSQLRLVKLSSEILPSSAQVAVVETDGQGTSIVSVIAFYTAGQETALTANSLRAAL